MVEKSGMTEAERKAYVQKAIAEFTPKQKEQFDATGRQIAALFGRMGFDPETQEFTDPVSVPKSPGQPKP
jgi:hypothetical protein